MQSFTYNKLGTYTTDCMKKSCFYKATNYIYTDKTKTCKKDITYFNLKK